MDLAKPATLIHARHAQRDAPGLRSWPKAADLLEQLKKALGLALFPELPKEVVVLSRYPCFFPYYLEGGTIDNPIWGHVAPLIVLDLFC